MHVNNCGTEFTCGSCGRLTKNHCPYHVHVKLIPVLPLHLDNNGSIITISSQVNWGIIVFASNKGVIPQHSQIFLQNQIFDYPSFCVLLQCIALCHLKGFFPILIVEFEKHYIPEDLVRLGCLALPGLARIPRTYWIPEDFELIDPSTIPPSTLKVQQSSGMTK